MSSWRRQAVILLVLAGLTGALLATGWWKRMLDTVGLLPVAWQRNLSDQADPDEDIMDLRERVIRLNVENVVLRRRLHEFTELAGSRDLSPPVQVVARGGITARTIRQGRSYCELDVGAVDGVMDGQPVLRGTTLVGVVDGLRPGRCQVRAVTDSESRIPAALFNEQECLAEGVLRGQGDPSIVLLDHVEDRPGLNITVGMRVVTSGLGGLPAGLVLGTVLAAERGSTADHWRIEVELVRTADRTDELVVVRVPATGG